jgi:hypothetical protein
MSVEAFVKFMAACSQESEMTQVSKEEKKRAYKREVMASLAEHNVTTLGDLRVACPRVNPLILTPSIGWTCEEALSAGNLVSEVEGGGLKITLGTASTMRPVDATISDVTDFAWAVAMRRS